MMLRSIFSKPQFSSSPLREPLLSEISNSLLKSESGIRKRMFGEKLKVLLFVPPYTRIEEPAPLDSPLREIGIEKEETMKRAGTPIGLLRIATPAINAGYKVKIVDAPFEGWENEKPLLYLPNGGTLIKYGLSDEQMRKITEDVCPDVVGIQCNYTCQWGNARALADLIKSLDKNIVVVMGGAHTSGDWENAIIDSPVDIICRNESDRHFVQLLDALTTEQGDIENIRGIVYRKDGRIISTNQQICGEEKSEYIPIKQKDELYRRLSMFPLPDFSLLNMGCYSLPYHSAGARMRKNGAWAQTFSSIGCNVGCNFCYIPMVNGPWRALGIDWFDLHLADLRKYGVSEVLLEDDHLLHDPLYALSVFELLKKHDLPWVEEGGLSLFNLVLLHKGENVLEMLPEKERKATLYKNAIGAMKNGLTAREFIRKMAQSGCYHVYLAIESANEESLGNSNKPRLNAMQMATIEIVKIFADSGIKVTGGFMLGFVNPPRRHGEAPYIESKWQIERTIDYAKTLMQAGIAYANPFIVTPLPGTKMWEFQKQFVVRDYDTGWSHERATLATSEWTADELETLRWRLMIEANGKDRVKEMLKRGTWPT